MSPKSAAKAAKAEQKKQQKKKEKAEKAAAVKQHKAKEEKKKSKLDAIKAKANKWKDKAFAAAEKVQELGASPEFKKWAAKAKDVLDGGGKIELSKFMDGLPPAIVKPLQKIVDKVVDKAAAAIDLGMFEKIFDSFMKLDLKSIEEKVSKGLESKSEEKEEKEPGEEPAKEEAAAEEKAEDEKKEEKKDEGKAPYEEVLAEKDAGTHSKLKQDNGFCLGIVDKSKELKGPDDMPWEVSRPWHVVFLLSHRVVEADRDTFDQRTNGWVFVDPPSSCQLKLMDGRQTLLAPPQGFVPEGTLRWQPGLGTLVVEAKAGERVYKGKFTLPRSKKDAKQTGVLILVAEQAVPRQEGV